MGTPFIPDKGIHPMTMPETPATTDTPVETDQTTPTDAPTDTGKTPPATEKDWKAEADKWKALARKHEDKSKENADKAKQFDDITEAQKTELEKANERAATAEARAAEVEARAVRAEVAAAKGVPASLLTGSTQEELEASADALLAFRGNTTPPDFGAGDRGGDAGKVTQMTQAELDKLTASGDYAAIVKARKEGRMNQLMQSKK